MRESGQITPAAVLGHRLVLLVLWALMAVLLLPALPLATGAAEPGTCADGAAGCAAADAAQLDDDGCPPLMQPENIHFLVINLDRSPNRLKRMREAFRNFSLPDFERVPGVEYDESKTYEVPRRTKHLKPADFGTCLAHREAWKRVYYGKHRWAVILEDDAELVPGIDLTKFPLVPKDADLVLLRHSTILKTEPVCKKTPIMRTTWGYGMVGYLVNRAGAKRMLDSCVNGFAGPLDGHIWVKNTVYTMPEDWISHAHCGNPCPDSIRTWLNGDLGNLPPPD